jgi:hypothetical protein
MAGRRTSGSIPSVLEHTPNMQLFFEFLPSFGYNPQQEPAWAAYSYSIPSFSVSSGNDVAIYLCFIEIGDSAPPDNPNVPIENSDLFAPAEAGFYGWVVFTNNDTGEAVSYLVPEPPDATPIGQCAEWIVETPQVSPTDDAPLPLFNAIQFTGPGACVIVNNPPMRDRRRRSPRSSDPPADLRCPQAAPRLEGPNAEPDPHRKTNQTNQKRKRIRVCAPLLRARRLG